MRCKDTHFFSHRKIRLQRTLPLTPHEKCGRSYRGTKKNLKHKPEIFI